jgi:hypothetical protein
MDFKRAARKNRSNIRKCLIFLISFGVTSPGAEKAGALCKLNRQ